VKERALPLQESSAYGDHPFDQFMLETVGNPFAVNPTSRLRRIALRKGWQVVIWGPSARRTPVPRHLLKWKGEAKQ